MEEAVNSEDNIKLANNIFKKFNRYKLSSDERKEIFLDAVWHTILNWKPEKSAFQTYLCNNVWYKIQTFLKKKLKKNNKEYTNLYLDGYISQTKNFNDDFDNIVAPLHDSYKIPLIQKFVYGMTMAEIGKENGYDKSYAAQMIKKGLEKIKKSV